MARNRESNVQARAMLALSEGGAVVFRQNVGTAFAGVVLDRTATTLTLGNPRPLHAGLCEGSSDIIGWVPVEITPDMIGQTLAVFVAAEVKTPTGRTTEAQERFLAAVRSSGGVAGVVRSEDEARALLPGNTRKKSKKHKP